MIAAKPLDVSEAADARRFHAFLTLSNMSGAELEELHEIEPRMRMINDVATLDQMREAVDLFISALAKRSKV